MSSGMKVTFLDPGLRGTRDENGGSTDVEAKGPIHGALMPRPLKRCGSPYPASQPMEDEPEVLGGYLHKTQSSSSSLHSVVSSVRTLYRRGTNKSQPSPDAEDESLQRYKQSLGLGGGKDLSDPNDPRVCIIQSLTMESPGRDPVVIDLSSPGSLDTLKKNPFKIKEGVTFTMSAKFKVQHEILSGLHYIQVIKRKGIRIPNGKTDEMIVRSGVSVNVGNHDANAAGPQGSYAPNTEQNPVYTKKCTSGPDPSTISHLGSPRSHHHQPPRGLRPANNESLVQEETAPTGWAVRDTYTVSSSFVDDDKKTHLQFDWAFKIDKDW